MSNRSYSQKTVKILYGESGNICAYPKCDEALIEDGTVVSNIAHMFPASQKGPRGGAATIPNLNQPENLLLLCLKHHKKVDDKPQDYPVEVLKQYKADHIADLKRRNVDYKISNEDLEKAVKFYNLSLKDVSNSQVITLQGDNNHFTVLANYMNTDQAIATLASTQYTQIVSDRISQLSEQMNKLQINTDQLTASLKDPATKEFISVSFRTASLVDDPDLYMILAKAIQERIKDADTDGARKDVAFAQVPDLISRLTKNQLKLLAVHYIATSLMVNNPPSLTLVDSVMGDILNPIGTVQYHKNDINQISGTSAGNYLSFWENKAFDKVKQQYEHLFIRPIPIESIDNSEISDDLKTACLTRVEQGYILKVGLAKIEEITKTNPNMVGYEAINQLAQMQKITDDEIRQKIAAEAPSLHRLITINDDTDLKGIDLSLPGKALAVAVIEGYSKQSLSSIWETDKEQRIFPFP